MTTDYVVRISAYLSARLTAAEKIFDTTLDVVIAKRITLDLPAESIAEHVRTTIDTVNVEARVTRGVKRHMNVASIFRSRRRNIAPKKRECEGPCDAAVGRRVSAWGAWIASVSGTPGVRVARACRIESSASR